MHAVTLDSSGSPRKRTFSRGMSEDESLRSIIKETESSSRRLSRSDSRAGTLKRRSDSQVGASLELQFEQDLNMGLPEMLELQTSYEEVVQELRGLEFEREALLCQVDILQDTLEGVEELLAEAQREAGQANSELEQEREAKKKLERMVCTLMQEVEKLKEEKNDKPPAPVNSHEYEREATQGFHMKNEQIPAVQRESTSTSALESHSGSNGGAVEVDGPSVVAEDVGGISTKQWKGVSKPVGHVPSLALDNPGTEDGVLQRPYENSINNGREPSPDRNDTDSISAYEDACAETPEQDKIFLGEEDALELPEDQKSEENSTTTNPPVNESSNESPKNPEGCVVS